MGWKASRILFKQPCISRETWSICTNVTLCNISDDVFHHSSTLRTNINTGACFAKAITEIPDYSLDSYSYVGNVNGAWRRHKPLAGKASILYKGPITVDALFPLLLFTAMLVPPLWQIAFARTTSRVNQ